MTAARAAGGLVNVVVTNGDTQSASLTNAYTYVSPPSVTSLAPSAGPTTGNTSVTITGGNFVSGATVTIGGVAATSVAFGGSTSMMVATPAHAAGSVDVVVTNPDAQTGTLPNGYTYAAQPTISAINPPAGPTAGNTNVTITGTNFGSPTLPWDMDSAAVVCCCLLSFDQSYKAWPSRVITVAMRRART